MKLTDIVAVSGMPGVYKVISRHKTGLVLENVQTKKRTSTGLRHRASNLNDISIYTEEGDLPLWEVYKKIKEKEDANESIPTHKASKAELEAGLAMVAKNYDKDRVYASDMKKLFQWYHMIKEDLDFDSLGKDDEESEEKPAAVEKKETKKAAPKKEVKATKSVKASSAASKVPKNSNRGK